ncbi:hypothetical protein RN001_007037 [Aquatica leii]|uniref:Uncharacterized protein n=1 Tax=Aquatica leii TaxID=1421715 RepID=A0AAN7PER1_9COLE|nr:hypothetical protein RN001_007037 [Aquatica leii]
MVYFYQINIQTLPRAAPWFMGLILGYILSKPQQPRLNKVLIWSLLVTSVFVLIVCIFIYELRHFKDENLVENAIRICVVHPLWSFAICWIIYACANGYIPKINRFLSLPIFEIIAKISYSMYIIHYTQMNNSVFSMRRRIIFDSYETAIEACEYLIKNALVATIATLAIEMPIISITKLLLNKY